MISRDRTHPHHLINLKITDRVQQNCLIYLQNNKSKVRTSQTEFNIDVIYEVRLIEHTNFTQNTRLDQTSRSYTALHRSKKQMIIFN